MQAISPATSQKRGAPWRSGATNRLDFVEDGGVSHPDRSERLIDEHEAATWITDGMTIAIGDPAPMAMIRHIVRLGVRDLTVVGSGLGLDLLIAARLVR